MSRLRALSLEASPSQARIPEPVLGVLAHVWVAAIGGPGTTGHTTESEAKANIPMTNDAYRVVQLAKTASIEKTHHTNMMRLVDGQPSKDAGITLGPRGTADNLKNQDLEWTTILQLVSPRIEMDVNWEPKQKRR